MISASRVPSAIKQSASVDSEAGSFAWDERYQLKTKLPGVMNSEILTKLCLIWSDHIDQLTTRLVTARYDDAPDPIFFTFFLSE